MSVINLREGSAILFVSAASPQLPLVSFSGTTIKLWCLWVLVFVLQVLS